MAQVVMSFVAADYAVEAGIPFFGFGPLPWWQAALRWPWSLALRLVGNTHPLAIMLILFAVYSGIVFLILRFLIVKPFLEGRPN
jgi:F0F1-type ATP synthase membrane subunit a